MKHIQRHILYFTCLCMVMLGGCIQKETPIMHWEVKQPTQQTLTLRNDLKGCLVSFSANTEYTQEILDTADVGDAQTWLKERREKAEELINQNEGYAYFTIARYNAGAPISEVLTLKFTSDYDYEKNQELLEYAGLAKYYDVQKKCIIADPDVLKEDPEFPYRYPLLKGIYTEELPPK
ncbi:MAG: hypothetical protein IIZ27_09060 [Solobacterium sp.]|nr:hypothetical protein [Solobacterium sp.]